MSEQPASTSSEWAAIIRSAAALRDLGDDWDGQGAEAARPGSVASAIRFLSALSRTTFPPPARVMLSPLGTVLVEYQSPGMRFAAEFGDAGEAEWFAAADQSGVQPGEANP